MCFDKSVETERSTTFESFEFSQSSSSVSHRTANKIGENDVTFVTSFWVGVPFPKGLWEAQSGQDGGKVFALQRMQPRGTTEVLREQGPATG